MPPLAERLRPKNLDEYIGQKHLVGKGAVLRRMIEDIYPPSYCGGRQELEKLRWHRL